NFDIRSSLLLSLQLLRSTTFPSTTLFRSRSHCCILSSEFMRLVTSARSTSLGQKLPPLERCHIQTSRLRFRRSFRICWQRSSGRSEEHTSELQSRSDLVCRLLLEKKKHTN